MCRFRPGFLTLVAAFGVSAAGAIQLDPSFRDGGIVALPQPTAATGVAVQSDGKIILLAPIPAGEPQVGVLLARLLPGGGPDLSFGTGGIVEAPLPSQFCSPNAVGVDPAGRILVVGTLQTGSAGSFFAARFASSGALDPAFGAGGVATVDFPGLYAGAGGMALQADGALVLAGGVSSPTAGDFAAARLLPDGALDPAFGSGGRVVLDLGTDFGESASSVVVRPDGRVVLGGRTNTGTTYEMTLAGLLPDGSPDPGFGAGGKTVLAVGGSECRGIAIQADGKITAAGPFYGSASGGTIAARFLASGLLDPSFGTGGTATVDLMSATGVALDAGGRVVVGGTGFNATMALTRFLADGRLDPSLGPAGYVHVLGGAPPQPATAWANAVAIQPNGRILLAGGQELTVLQLLTVVRFADPSTPVPALSGVALAGFAVLLAAASVFALTRAV